MGCAASRAQPTEDGTASHAGSANSIIATKQAVTQDVTWGPGAFPNAAALEKALRDHKVDVAAWERDGAKGVAQLFTELENRESELHVESGRVTRCLRVVKVRALPIPSHFSSHIALHPILARTLPAARMPASLPPSTPALRRCASNGRGPTEYSSR